jgi:hypothetical protein
MRLKDSIVVSIPLNLTVDLGYCVERTKQKRLRKLRQWEKKHLPANTNNADDTKSKTSNGSQHESDVENTKDKSSKVLNDDEMKKNLESSSKEDISEDIIMSEEEDITPSSSNILRREQFGGIIDYLEAKYARGVMVEEPDEKLRRKEKLRKRKLKQMQQKKSAKRSKIDEDEAGNSSTGDVVKEDGGKEEEKDLTDEEDLDYSTADDARSIYSEDSFLDDSLLIKGVAEQVQASSAYGAVTKIESEARKSKAESGESSFHEGILVDHGDAGFFVNVGDLEMDEDYEAAVDWHLPEKNKSKRFVLLKSLSSPK